jgi:hypothetical protein
MDFSIRMLPIFSGFKDPPFGYMLIIIPLTFFSSLLMVYTSKFYNMSFGLNSFICLS